MKQIQLRNLDLNLLVIFRVLMDEGSINRAAEQLGRTPSAISHALGRLRNQLGDPLMVRVSGKMQPSPRALVFYEEIKPVLQQIERAVQPPRAFDPATSERIFRIAGPTCNVLITRVVALIQQEAPGVGLEWVPPSVETVPQLIEEQIDLVWGNANFALPEGLKAKLLPPFKRYVFARYGHPGSNQWSLDTWLRWPHVVVRIPAATHATVEERIVSLSLKRRIGLHLPNWAGIVPALLETNMLANQVPLMLVDHPGFSDLLVLEPPLPLPDLAMRIMWNARLDGDPAIRWLRQLFKKALDIALSDTHEKLKASNIVYPTSALP